MSKSDQLVIVTGCGYSPVRQVFVDPVSGLPQHDGLQIRAGNQPEMTEVKLNIGAATVRQLLARGWPVRMVSHSPDKLQALAVSFCREFPAANLTWDAVDLFSSQAIADWVERLPLTPTKHLVHSLGVSSGAVKLPDGNPYWPMEQVEAEYLRAELSVVEATHQLLQALRVRLWQQPRTRLVFITSMSAVRYYLYGTSHCAAKAALDAYVKTIDLEWASHGVLVTKIRPGMVDTGLYDAQRVQSINWEIMAQAGISPNTYFPVLSPRAVGEAVALALEGEAHVSTINLLAIGQERMEGT